MAKKFLTIKDVAKRLQIGGRSVYRYIENNELKAVKIGRWRITEQALKDFIRSRDSSNIK